MPDRLPAPSLIIKRVERICGATPRSVKSPSRSKTTTYARKFACVMLRDILGFSRAQIAVHVGIDSTTVKYHLQTAGSLDVDLDCIKSLVLKRQVQHHRPDHGDWQSWMRRESMAATPKLGRLLLDEWRRSREGGAD